jgi:hypothetical protein
LHVQPDLHAKVILVDDRVLLLGSANLTAAGLQLTPGGNRELGIQMVPSRGDINSIDGLFADACEITPALYDALKAEVTKLQEVPMPDLDWPLHLAHQLLPKATSRLWVSEFLWTNDPSELNSTWVNSETASHDANLLGLSSLSPSISELQLAFRRSRSYTFLRRYFERRGKNELYFGELTSAVEESLLDDPRPYRRDVKELTASLLGWLAHLGGDTFVVDRPNYSQRLRILNEKDEPVVQAEFLRMFELLHVDVSAGWSGLTTGRAPHKPLLLLEVIRRIGSGQVESNIVLPTSELESAFDQMWRRIFGDSKRTTMALPFYHLQTDGFWHLHSSIVSEIPESARQSPLQLRDLNMFAWIDDALFSLLQTDSFREAAADVLIATYFRGNAAESLRRYLR